MSEVLEDLGRRMMGDLREQGLVRSIRGATEVVERLEKGEEHELHDVGQQVSRFWRCRG